MSACDIFIMNFQKYNTNKLRQSIIIGWNPKARLKFIYDLKFGFFFLIFIQIFFKI